MKRTFNLTIHSIGTAAILFGLLMAVKAAGMADLDGDFNEIVHLCLAGSAALGIGAFLRWWTV